MVPRTLASHHHTPPFLRPLILPWKLATIASTTAIFDPIFSSTTSSPSQLKSTRGGPLGLIAVKVETCDLFPILLPPFCSPFPDPLHWTLVRLGIIRKRKRKYIPPLRTSLQVICMPSPLLAQVTASWTRSCSNRALDGWAKALQRIASPIGRSSHPGLSIGIVPGCERGAAIAPPSQAVSTNRVLLPGL